MIGPGQFFRLTRIQLAMLRNGVDEVVLATPIFRPLRFLGIFMPWRWVRSSSVPRGVRLRRALEELGPIFVKLGQILSTRRDFLPADVAEELAMLQNKVPPFPYEDARRIVERSLGEPVSAAFGEFNNVPIASASIAQVHGAKLHDGTEVVVKIVRPGIRNVIHHDIELLYTAARLAERYVPDARRLHPVEVIAELEKNLNDELDLMREAANASQLRRNFEDSNLLYVPAIFWRYTSRDVLVMERIEGIPVSDIETLRAHGTNLKLLAERGTEIFFTQVFRHSFFHADMHPGNVFVDPNRPDDPRYIAIDFGIMGSLSPVDHHYLAGNFMAFFNRDYRRVAELHVESGWVPENTRVDELEAAIRTVCEPIFERPLHEISFAQLLIRLFQTGRRFDMQVQPQLVLLQKTLLNVEGLGRSLYPDLDLWVTAKPFLQRWMRDELGPHAVMRKMRRQFPEWGEKLPELPNRLDRGLNDLQTVRTEMQRQSQEMANLRNDLRRSNRRMYAVIAGSALIIAALLAYQGGATDSLAEVPLAAWLLGSAGLIGLGYALRR
ncbi:ubiquinone biosynthesis regulatory protein kinase UbiB [Halorhodospira halochloris]|uniref:Probable protein kinase UbiB n=1 Tax=Halorhodospira halochloris TaxID=1052 RepID=A0A0X8X6V7_HALHR|nr:ubiquinone biosynthesis regulatory protein kinase UbiB [Halorhodospira halochloris]MBK1650811.1 ubiquinone biosynthesis regulatory protein kinase UbiB [Halorhodospira halochloris]MCG5530251.1 ubiquinone biosynthesis regulatory protein kinase UbiB [Halorhodospira halochloris]MCG5547165.1 ubiquinone biosynthesis regulatory protein kinase UbiB [Halorhodospira halochloris]BAU56690.1 ubiquinone biosynthesis monooxygenase UbiB [Halorhodospira halochloris]